MYRATLIFVFLFSLQVNAKTMTWSNFHKKTLTDIRKLPPQKKKSLSYMKRLSKKVNVLTEKLGQQNQKLVLQLKDNSQIENDLFEFRSLQGALDYMQSLIQPNMNCEIFVQELSYYVNPSNNNISDVAKISIALANKVCPI